MPSADEWKGQWKLKPVHQRVCRGAGKKRACRPEPKTAVDEANRQAVLRATPWNTRQGNNGGVRFPFDAKAQPIYEIVTSPHEFTYLALLDGERQATQLMLNPAHWEVYYGKSGEEGSRQEMLTVRPQVQKDGKSAAADAGDGRVPKWRQAAPALQGAGTARHDQRGVVSPGGRQKAGAAARGGAAPGV